MSLVTRQSTANQTPDSGQGGSAVTGNSNTGHGSTTSSAGSLATVEKTCRWFDFPAAPGGQVVSAILKADWSENGSLVDGSTSFRLQYSTSGSGGPWTTLFDHINVSTPANGTANLTLANNQDLTQVQVRDRVRAQGGVSGGDTVTGSISNIRIEIITTDGLVIVLM